MELEDRHCVHGAKPVLCHLCQSMDTQPETDEMEGGQDFLKMFTVMSSEQIRMARGRLLKLNGDVTAALTDTGKTDILPMMEAVVANEEEVVKSLQRHRDHLHSLVDQHHQQQMNLVQQHQHQMLHQLLVARTEGLNCESRLADLRKRVEDRLSAVKAYTDPLTDTHRQLIDTDADSWRDRFTCLTREKPNLKVIMQTLKAELPEVTFGDLQSVMAKVVIERVSDQQMSDEPVCGQLSPIHSFEMQQENRPVSQQENRPGSQQENRPGSQQENRPGSQQENRPVSDWEHRPKWRSGPLLQQENRPRWENGPLSQWEHRPGWENGPPQWQHRPRWENGPPQWQHRPRWENGPPQWQHRPRWENGPLESQQENRPMSKKGEKAMLKEAKRSMSAEEKKELRLKRKKLKQERSKIRQERETATWSHSDDEGPSLVGSATAVPADSVPATSAVPVPSHPASSSSAHACGASCGALPSESTGTVDVGETQNTDSVDAGEAQPSPPVGTQTAVKPANTSSRWWPKEPVRAAEHAESRRMIVAKRREMEERLGVPQAVGGGCDKVVSITTLPGYTPVMLAGRRIKATAIAPRPDGKAWVVYRKIASLDLMKESGRICQAIQVGHNPTLVAAYGAYGNEVLVAHSNPLFLTFHTKRGQASFPLFAWFRYRALAVTASGIAIADYHSIFWVPVEDDMSCIRVCHDMKNVSSLAILTHKGKEVICAADVHTGRVHFFVQDMLRNFTPYPAFGFQEYQNLSNKQIKSLRLKPCQVKRFNPVSISAHPAGFLAVLDAASLSVFVVDVPKVLEEGLTGLDCVVSVIPQDRLCEGVPTTIAFNIGPQAYQDPKLWVATREGCLCVVPLVLLPW